MLRRPTLKSAYDVVIIGGGGHGLATAYFLAKQHGMRNIAVLERGAIGQGNSGRNTQVVRSDYFHLRARGSSTVRCGSTRGSAAS